MEMHLADNITVLKGIGDKTAALFRRMGVETVEELLRFYPRDYDRIEEVSRIAGLQDNSRAVVRGTICSGVSERKAGRLSVSLSQTADETGKLQLSFFNMPYIKGMLKKGAVYYFRGKVHKRGNGFTMEQPLLLSPAEYEKQQGKLLPVYPLTNGLNQKAVRKAVLQVLEAAGEQGELLPEILPLRIREEQKLCGVWEALSKIHFPKCQEELLQAKKRLAFEEFLVFLLLIQKMKASAKAVPNAFPMLETADTGRFLEGLPFRLTKDQEQVWQDILDDMTGAYTMNRLVQGDVGSGKTVLAALALLLAAANGYQGAMMAPTEVLAVQHFQTLRGYAEKYHLPFQPVLLTGSLTAEEKRAAYGKIETGACNLIIGTHALIQEKVNYHKLALVITDEQHRFGVRQRETFSQKGMGKSEGEGGCIPHVMVMSATPIPRTLAMILYGDLHVSVIKQLPAGRQAVKNCVVGTDWRGRAWHFLEKEIKGGRQVFVICPMIEASEESDLENVEEYTQKLRAGLPADFRIEMLHGKMKPAEKNRLMDAFGAGMIDILVSTTVIEVGVNIPNATVMLIENAERFGLAQLHQLRGRVGRGAHQSYCIFINGSGSDRAKERLEVLNHSNDGFYIAEQDLKLRGPGDMFGVRQSGILNFRIADIYQDADMLMQADKVCRGITSDGAWEEKEEYLQLSSLLKRSGRNNIDFPGI